MAKKEKETAPEINKIKGNLNPEYEFNPGEETYYHYQSKPATFNPDGTLAGPTRVNIDTPNEYAQNQKLGFSGQVITVYHNPALNED